MAKTKKTKTVAEPTRVIRGYKVFNPDFTCRGHQFAENTEYTIDGPISICNRGFHFCVKAAHCFSYYGFDSKNIVCEVEALGETQMHGEDSKVCTNHIRIGRRLTWEEVLQVANDGKENTGHSNTGYSNTGSWNTGDRNTGDRNTGDRNTGDWNTGYSNTGDRNTGYRNTGDWNTGSWNTGDRNTGYSNTGSGHTGAFCTGTADFPLFNKPSGMTFEQFTESIAFDLMRQVDTKMWVPSSRMTDEEKSANPSHQTCEGYLKDIPFKEAFQNCWHNWSERNRKAFTDLPNFDAEIFFEITGVRV